MQQMQRFSSWTRFLHLNSPGELKFPVPLTITSGMRLKVKTVSDVEIFKLQHYSTVMVKTEFRDHSNYRHQEAALLFPLKQTHADTMGHVLEGLDHTRHQQPSQRPSGHDFSLSPPSAIFILMQKNDLGTSLCCNTATGSFGSGSSLNCRL